jgi:hypothetical protein
VIYDQFVRENHQDDEGYQLLGEERGQEKMRRREGWEK